MHTMKNIIAGALAMATLASHQTAWAQDKAQCLQTNEAEALVTMVMPGVFQAVSQSCASYVPADSLLGEPSEYIESVLRPAAELAFPEAIVAFQSIGGPELPEGVDYQTMSALLDLFIGQQIAKDIKPDSCGAIDRALTTLTALNPEQSSTMIIAVVELATAGDANSKLPLCRAAIVSE